MSNKFSTLDETIYHAIGIEKATRFIRAHHSLILYLIALAVIAYGYDIFSFALKIDSEHHAVNIGAEPAWLTEGRWGMYFLNVYLFPDPVMPVLPVLVGLLGLVVGVLFYLMSLSDQRSIKDWLAAPFAIGCSLLAFAFYFSTFGYGVGVAFAAAGAGMYLLTRDNRRGIFLSILLFAFAIGTYQAILLLICVFYGFYFVVFIIETPDITLPVLRRKLLQFFVVLIAAYGVFEAIKHYTLYAYGMNYSQEYLESYITFKPDWNYVSSALFKTFQVAKDGYTGGEQFYIYPLKILAFTFFIALALVVFRIFIARQSALIKIFGLIALVASISVPFLLHFLNNGYMPVRVLLGIPFVFTGLIFAASGINSKMLKLLLGTLTLACFFNFAVINNRYALSSQMSWKADQDLSLMILQRIQSLWHKLPAGTYPYPVELVGEWQHHESSLYVKRDVIGASFYHWDSGSAERMVKLWYTMRQFDFRPALPDERVSVSKDAANMPVWPAPGSVDVINGVIVVKIGDYHEWEQQQLEMLKRAKLQVTQLLSEPIPLSGNIEMIYDNSSVSFNQARGYWTLFYFGAADCKEVCSGELQKLGQLLKQFEASGIPTEELPRAVFVSLDANAKSENLKHDAHRYHTGIYGVSGSDAQLKKIMEAFGLPYSRTENSTRIFIVDPGSRYVGSFKSPNDANVIYDDLKILME